MGRAWAALRALLTKNWVLKARHPVATWSELASPLLCILLFALLNSLDTDLRMPAGWTTASANDSAPELGSRWSLFAQTDLMSELNSSLESAGVSSDALFGGLDASGSGSSRSSLSSTAMLLQLTSALKIPKFYFTETTMPGLLVSLALQGFMEGERLNELSRDDMLGCALKFVLLGYTGQVGSSPYAVPVECRGRVVPFRIAVTPDNVFTREYFAATMDKWHPRLPLAPSVYGISMLTAPSFRDSSVFFDNESALEAYMATEDYGTSSKQPKIYAAIAFEQFPTGADIGDTSGHPIAYSLRFNASYASSGFPSSVPHTRRTSRFASSISKLVNSAAALSYSTRGFMTLQTAVARFLNCMPDWDSASQSTTGECQLLQAVSNASNEDEDARLMQQVESDMILSSAFNVITSMKDLLPESLRSGGSGSDGELSVSAATIPDSSKQQLLQSLRIAPQAHMGAGVFVAPKPAFRYAPFYDKVSVVFPVGFVLSYLYTVSRMIVAFLTEKETRSRELMRIFGVSDALLFASWLLTYVVLLALATALQTAGARALLFPNSSPSLLFAFFFSFALSSFAFAFLVSAFFSRARSGSFVGMALFFMLFFVSYSFGEETGESQRTWASLLSPVALAQGINILAKVEAVSVGISSANAGKMINGFRFETVIYMQLVDFALYVAVAAYAQMVVPQEFGVPEKWYFLATPTYWRRSLGLASSSSSRSKVANDGEVALSSASHHVEAVGEDLRLQEREARAVVITGLSKEYKARVGGVKIAVNNLRLTLYEGQVTCLLGHNGAGKSTLMSMLTGMTAPSSGGAVIRGYPISTSMPRVRELLGYCPQASVLYPELTVEEHLRLYGCIKGLTCSLELDKEVRAKITEVGLETKRCTKAHALSGGMQRRLSLAIAFLGESKVVFLDEPTSGMDPYSRRSTWELIRSNRRGRIVVLTTHFMNEADVLGDRIAILADGALQCVGSSLFLKNHFGVGYRLSMTLQTIANNDQSCMDQQNAPLSSLVSLVRVHVPSAVVATSVGTELTLQLPFESASAFPKLFRELESSRTELGVLSYAISVTTLEEVFLKVLEGGQQYLGGTEDKNREAVGDGAAVHALEAPTQVVVAVSEPNGIAKRDQTGVPLESVASSGTDCIKLRHRQLQHGRRLVLRQFAALVCKRAQYGKRDRNMLVFRTVLPLVVIFTGLAALRQSVFLKNDSKKLLVTANEYSLGSRTPIPVSFPGETLFTSPFGDVLTDATFTGGELFEVGIPQQVYDGSTTPTVFGITYSSPELKPNDTSGYCLRFSELALESGFGVEAPETTEASEDEPIQVVDGQQGGYVVYGSTEDQVLAYNVLVNTSATHAAPIYKAMMDEAIHRHLLMRHAASSGRPMTQEEVERVAIRVSSHPLPLSFKTRTLFGSFLSLPAVIFVVIAFTFIPASVVPFLVREKQDGQNAKYQQLLSGVSLPAYWLANFAFDMALYAVPMAGAILLLRGFGVSSSLSNSGAACLTCTQDSPSALVALFVLFGTAVAPWTYLFSHFMHDPRACLLYTIMLNFLLGTVLILISYTMNTLESTKPANDALVYIWRLSPLFSLGNGLLSVIIADIKALYGLTGHVVSAFDAEIAGTEIAYLAVQGPVYFLLTVFVDEYRNRTARHDTRSITGGNFSTFQSWMVAFARLVTRRRTATGDQQGSESTLSDNNDPDNDDDEKEDEDIAAETRRLRNVPTKTGNGKPLLSQPVKVIGLRKRYPNGKLAVRNLTFGLGAGECFGFLGVNGAGKTTTMRILTGDLAPTAGSASLNGFDILTQRRDARRSIGYCPQFDALLDLLTVREHLELYAQLKGLGPIMKDEILRLLQKLHLEQFEHKLAGALSGGNKRKLSVAIALLGDPKVVFLDEPSTGMDPASRRLMWDVILDVSVRSKRSTVVLTTHSMDECEALCSKAGIMVDGRLQCLGSISHLKARFGDGFLLDCKLRPATTDEIKQLQLDRLSVLGQEIDSSKAADVCAALGDVERAAAFLASVAPNARKDRPTADSISVSHLCAWWIKEDRMEALAAFLHRHFSCSDMTGSRDDCSVDRRRGEVVQLERQGDYCRYRLAASETETSLAEMFELIEGAKAALAIQEYSVSHTSLEQIFNNFARQQQSSNPPV